MVSTIISWVFIRTVFSLVALSALLISMTVPAFCGELRKYDLPSQEQRPYREFQERPRRYPAYEEFQEMRRRPPEDRGVYTQFREEVSRLSPGERKQLREAFNETLQKTKDWRQRKHYSKLISILEECGTEP